MCYNRYWCFRTFRKSILRYFKVFTNSLVTYYMQLPFISSREKPPASQWKRVQRPPAFFIFFNNIIQIHFVMFEMTWCCVFGGTWIFQIKLELNWTFEVLILEFYFPVGLDVRVYNLRFKFQLFTLKVKTFQWIFLSLQWKILKIYNFPRRIATNNCQQSTLSIHIISK